MALAGCEGLGGVIAPAQGLDTCASGHVDCALAADGTVTLTVVFAVLYVFALFAFIREWRRKS